MTHFANAIELFNSALIRCGEEHISEHDDSAFSVLFRSSYEAVARDCLSRQRLTFAKKTENLRYQGETGNTPRYAYVKPNDCLLEHKVTVGNGDGRISYETRSGKILSDYRSNDLFLHYTYRAPENVWPGDFTEAVVTKMRGLIRGFQEEDHAASALAAEGEDKLILSIARHRLAMTAPLHTPRPRLVAARYGRVDRG